MTMTTRREAMALISGALASTTLGDRAFAEGAPRKGGTLRISAPANPSSLDPATPAPITPSCSRCTTR
ncbi:hypothetical protein [Bradyrhizobium mercantei]|uniref:hypothetical protein n=1 Tax=Bradyrhizobium mercantei TaxID=1904807 RepID=UPI001FDA7343|nr:hypothetical protein [Bradyrhizobium mercantei]